MDKRNYVIVDKVLIISQKTPTVLHKTHIIALSFVPVKSF